MKNKIHLSNVQNPCWVLILGDYTTQSIGNSNNPRTGNPYKPTSIINWAYWVFIAVNSSEDLARRRSRNQLLSAHWYAKTHPKMPSFWDQRNLATKKPSDPRDMSETIWEGPYIVGKYPHVSSKIETSGYFWWLGDPQWLQKAPFQMGGVLLAPSSLCSIMVESPLARKPGWVLNGLVKSSCLWDTKQATWRKKGEALEWLQNLMES